MFYLILFKYSGVFPKSFFFCQSIGSSTFFALERMFSIALVTMKFLPDFNPWTGLSVTFGTLSFLCLQSYEKFLTKNMRKNTWRQGLVAHGSCLFFQKVFGNRLAIPLNMPKGLRITVFSVCLQPSGVFSPVISSLY